MSRKKGGTYESLFTYIHKSRLLKKWGGNYMYMEQDFHVTSFLTSYVIDSQVSFRIFYFIYGIWQFVSELIEYVYKYTEIKGLDWREIYIIAREQKKWWTWHVISLIAKNETRKVYVQPVSHTICTVDQSFAH